MDRDEPLRLSRKQLLRAGAASLTGGFAGCWRSADPAAEGSDSNSDSTTDSESPTITRAAAVTTSQEGTLRFEIAAEDDDGISRVSVSTPIDTQTETFDDTESIDIEGSLEATPGNSVSVEFETTDSRGNDAVETRETYVRSADVPDDVTLDLGALYRLSPNFAEPCVSGEPERGRYSDLTTSVLTDHFDQLQGHGVSRLIVPVERREHVAEVSTFDESPLGAETAVQFRLHFLVRDIPLEDQLQFVADGIRQLSSYETYRDRPVVSLPQLGTFGRPDIPVTPIWEQLRSTHGDGAGVVDFIRDELTIDGVEPFLVGETRRADPHMVNPRHHESPPYEDFLRQFDAVRNGVYPPRGDGDEPWEDWLEETKARIRVLWQFAHENDLEFVPQVAPGFAGCPSERGLPRETDRFAALLRYAAGYATTDEVVVHSFNDWYHGSQIEAGTAGGADYGRSYLSVARRIGRRQTFPARVDRERYHVGPDGSDANVGTASEPLATLQEALMRATPGDTIRLQPGRYRESAYTVRDGLPDTPITITGPEDAVLQPPASGSALWIKNSHIHLTGLTFDGLLDPDDPTDPASYSDGNLIHVRPPDDTDDYLEHIVCSPIGIGNAGEALMVFNRTKHLEVGPLRVIGAAGANWILSGESERHAGEIVYLGTPHRSIYEGNQPWSTLDETRHVHVHHIDNSDGHPHSELVNTKVGTRDVLVEYCTDGGGSQNNEPNPAASVRFEGTGDTLRWCDLRDGEGHGVFLGRENNAVYGNRIQGFDGNDVELGTDPVDQELLCGNDVSESTHGDPDAPCPTDLPEGDGIGHLGGDSPWDEP